MFAGFVNEYKQFPRQQMAFVVDGLSTVAGSLMGTSPISTCAALGTLASKHRHRWLENTAALSSLAHTAHSHLHPQSGCAVLIFT